MGFLTIIGGAAAGVGKWLLRNPTLLAIAMLSAAFVLVVVSKNSEIKTLAHESAEKDNRISQLTSGLATARNNVATLNGALMTQNASITALKTQGDEQDTKFDLIIKGQAEANASTAKKIAAIDAARPGADKCQSAFDLVRSTVQ